MGVPQNIGFSAENDAVAGITTTYAAARVATLDATAITNENRLGLPPPGAVLDNIEMWFTVTAGVPTRVQGYLAYDVAGDYHCTTEFDVPLTTGLTTGTLRSAVALVQMTKAPPTTAQVTSNGKYYLFLKTDAGTVRLDRANLQWRRQRDA